MRRLTRTQPAGPTCPACGHRIIWVQMAPNATGGPGGKMPCNPTWLYGDGRRTLIVLDEGLRGHSVVKAGENVFGRESHFGTCPKKERLKRRQSTIGLETRQ